jgi:hypothetical protein
MIKKIYWYGFKRQLKELYYLLFAEGCISCSWDEFSVHFTGKKFGAERNYTKKLKWGKNENHLNSLINYLTEKGFLRDSENVLKHFNYVSNSAIKKNRNPRKQKRGEEFQFKLSRLFPASSGYRCKERLYYKARNKEPMNSVLNGLTQM